MYIVYIFYNFQLKSLPIFVITLLAWVKMVNIIILCETDKNEYPHISAFVVTLKNLEKKPISTQTYASRAEKVGAI